MLNSKCTHTIIGINIFLLIICTFLGCKKNANNSVSSTFPKDGLAYIQFNTGKYFIYKDSATLKTDSVVVTESLLQPTSTTIGNALYNEQQYSLILSKIDSSGKADEWLSGIAYSGPGELNDIALVRNDSLNASGYCFRYPPCNCGNEINIPSMIVEGKTYTDVVVTANDSSTYAPSAYYYWAAGTGLIKRSEMDNSGITKTYTLLRSN
jgi:hypothetical protein